MRTEHSARPVLMAGLGVLVLSCMDAVMKIVSASYPIAQVVGLRYAAGASFALIAFAIMGCPGLTLDAVRRNLIRAVVVLATATCFFTAIARLPLVEAVALTFIGPLFMALLGRVILDEPISARALAAIAIGFGGVVVIGRGQESSGAFDLLGIAAALACAFFYALSMVLMRQQSAKDSTITIVALSNLLAVVLVLPLMAWQWQPVAAGDVGVFALAGLLGTCGHLCMAWAYSRAHAGRLGVLEYSAFLWISILGYVVFGEIPTGWTIAGAALIIAACAMATLTRSRG